jgi:hypothetical protein
MNIQTQATLDRKNFHCDSLAALRRFLIAFMTGDRISALMTVAVGVHLHCHKPTVLFKAQLPSFYSDKR